jgi:inositol-phosphate phosphatase/L-galactose 1-phosphate phosphatase
MSLDIDELFDFAVEIAKKAGQKIKTAFHEPKNIDYKGQIDLVTETDKAVEEMLVNSIRTKYPGHLFVAEESVSAGSAKEELTDAATWCIDPIDGTTNFVHKFPFSCVSIGFLFKKRTVVGVVYNPMLEELFTAKRGHGAFKNGIRLQVSQTIELKKSLLATGFPYDRSPENVDLVLKRLRQVLFNVRDVRRAGSAALDMCYVAAGVLDIYYETGVHAWDVAAATLFVEEAGGKVSMLDGSVFDMCKREVLCSNGKLHDRVIAIL